VPTFQAESGFTKTAAQPAREGVDLARGPRYPEMLSRGMMCDQGCHPGSWLEQKEGRGDVKN